jgi:hypothetical protein
LPQQVFPGWGICWSVFKESRCVSHPTIINLYWISKIQSLAQCTFHIVLDILYIAACS